MSVRVTITSKSVVSYHRCLRNADRRRAQEPHRRGDFRARQAQVEDLTGGGDHFRAEVVSERFAGLSRIDQHKLVYDVFGDEVGGPIHALSIKTSTPERRPPMTNDEIRAFLEEAIKENPVMLFMKGTPDQPALRLLDAHLRGAQRARRASTRRSTSCPTRASARSCRRSPSWPTIPQLFVEGKLVGGCDIVTEMYETGELAELLGVEQPADEPEAPVHGGAGDGSRSSVRSWASRTAWAEPVSGTPRSGCESWMTSSPCTSTGTRRCFVRSSISVRSDLRYGHADLVVVDALRVQPARDLAARARGSSSASGSGRASVTSRGRPPAAPARASAAASLVLDRAESAASA